jgi:hypothetical protein
MLAKCFSWRARSCVLQRDYLYKENMLAIWKENHGFYAEQFEQLISTMDASNCNLCLGCWQGALVRA